jgi:hypothetical protein
MAREELVGCSSARPGGVGRYEVHVRRHTECRAGRRSTYTSGIWFLSVSHAKCPLPTPPQPSSRNSYVGS